MTVQVVRRAFDLTPPATPTNASATSPNASLNTFHWTHTTTGDFSNFWIERSYDGTNWGYLRTYTATGVNFSINDNTFDPGNRVWYRVASQDVRGNKSAYTTGVSTKYDNPINILVGNSYLVGNVADPYVNRVVLSGGTFTVSTGTCAMSLTANGDLTCTPSTENARDWYLGYPVTGIGASFDVRFVTQTGTLSSANADTWFNLASQRTFTVSTGTIFTGTLQVRDTATQTIRAQNTYTLRSFNA